MEERQEKLIVYAGNNLDLIGKYALGSLAENFHTDEDSCKDDYPGEEPCKYEIKITVTPI